MSIIWKLVYGQKSEKSEVTPDGGEQMSIFNEAEASAVIYSLAATAMANGLNVEEYFTKLCKKELILPWNTDYRCN